MSPAPDSSPPARARAPGVLDYTLRPLAVVDPLRWIALGWRDFIRAPGIGLFYGAAFAGMGYLLLYLFSHAPAYVLALAAGFLLVGPFMCLGLYQVSQRLERGERPDLGDSLLAWEDRIGALALFGGALLILELIWARASLVVFALAFEGMPDLQGSLRALLDPQNLEFIVWYLAVGGLFAGLIFAVSVVSIPMLLDQPVDAITAALTSLRLVLAQPLVMLWWGVLITLIVVLAMLPFFAGLLVAAPVVGHASWHAYRHAVIAPEPGAPAIEPAASVGANLP